MPSRAGFQVLGFLKSAREMVFTVVPDCALDFGLSLLNFRHCMNSSWLAVLCLELLLFMPALVRGDSPSYSSRLWQTDEGLPHNSVHSVVQTADGYLWI